ncbi:LysR substrate-binding domain-containing protein [Enterovibrio calviensis]|uniref:LysR substrate-binding domain-containing protein n=1 Tax=Enterovibrio calviensis TaxID=91359 RepID=UPI00373555D2
MFSYEHLKSFCATFEEQSYSAAARKLNKDRTTIREQVKALEDSYLTELFTIEGKRAIATDFSQLIYPQANLIVKNSERLHLCMLNAYKEDLTSLDFYHDTMMPNDLVVIIDAYLLKHHPNITLNWRHRNRGEIFDAVSNGHNKVAIMQHRMVNISNTAIMNIKLGDSDIAPFARVDSPLFNQKTLQLEDLQLETQYISENHFESMPEFLAVSPNPRVISNNDMLIELVRKSGWAVLNSTLAAPEVAANRLKKIEFKELTSTAKFGLSFYFPMSFESTNIYQGLVDTIQEYAKKHL